MQSNVKELSDIVIRFSGDSGDGMQLTGSLFSNTVVAEGTNVATFPDYPAEIRAPQGTVAGVSGFQVHIGTKLVTTPGDYADILVAMNPAAIKANISHLMERSVIIYDEDSFTERNFKKAGYTQNPFEEDKLTHHTLVPINIAKNTRAALMGLDLKDADILRSKNMYALGVVCWMFTIPLSDIIPLIEQKFAKKENLREANITVLKAGESYGNTMRLAAPNYYIPRPEKKEGLYRYLNGNVATAWGALAASEKAQLPIFVGSYPITPATDILIELSKYRNLGVKTFQAEDEIAGICSAIGAAYAGNLAITTTSGPGLALKSEAIGLAIMAELPLVIVNVQRGGPSTGLPTKTEQADLNQALYGRNGESHCPVLAAKSPSDCFYQMFLACKIAVERMTPVILLTDGFLANGSAPFRIPDMDKLGNISPNFVTTPPEEFQSFQRAPETFARQWAIPGMKGYEHRIGGLEKDDSGMVSYVPEVHHDMVKKRQTKIDKIGDYAPDLHVEGAPEGDLLVVGWGSTFGHTSYAVRELVEKGNKVGLAHFTNILPLPANTAEVFAKYQKIVVAELNNGQFVNFLRAKVPGFSYLQYNKIAGQPFTMRELKKEFERVLKG